jgi:CheY-like chemotaxis protein
VREGEFDLVLMDVHMPEMDGFAAAQAIRQAERETGNHVVIIALTANALAHGRLPFEALAHACPALDARTVASRSEGD